MNCPNCTAVFSTPINNCAACGYPFSGTDREKSSFIAQQIMKKGDIDDARESLKTAKRTLFIIGTINIVIVLFMGGSSFYVGLSLFIGAIFILFGFMVKKSPLVFLVIPLLLLLMFYMGDAIADPLTIFNGLVLKIAYVSSLTYAIVRIVRADKLKKESDYLGQQ